MTDQEKTTSWKELWEKTLELGLGAVTLTKETAQKLANELIEKGHMTKQESEHFVERMRVAGKEQKEHLEELVAKMVDKALEKTDIARGSEVKKLEARIAELEGELRKRA
jgi:polyhydroxyalkanoate synthesis regulator phasin